jgi:hypothetical protein
MGGEASREQRQQQLVAQNDQMRQTHESQMAILAQHDQRTKVPHLLIELRSLGYIEVCGKNIGGIYERLSQWLPQTFRCQPAALCFQPQAGLQCGCCVQDQNHMLPMQPHHQVCDMNFVCGQQGLDGTVMPNGVFQARGQEGENNMGKLTMVVINYMCHEMGWGLHLCDGGNNGRYGQFREQQIKFKAPHPLNLIAPHLMIELRQVGYIEVNGPDTNGIYGKLADFFKAKWGATQIQNDPNYCDLKFQTPSFKARGSEGENNMGLRTCEVVDFLTQNCAWTLITCNGGNYGRKGDKREQQMVFRNDEHIQHGDKHVMVELRDRGYIEINGLHDSPEIASALDGFYKRQGCQDYKTGMWESKEMFCDHKYTTAAGFYYRQGTTNNLGKRTMELAAFMSSQGWMLMLANGGNISNLEGWNIKREQQNKFTKARPGENAQAPLLMLELRTVPQGYDGSFMGLLEVNGPDTNGIYQKLATYMQQTMLAQPAGVGVGYCDLLFNVACFRLRDHSNGMHELRWNGKLNGESNFGRYTMRLCDFMVDHVGEWDLIVCNGNSIDTVFRVGKDDTISVTGREQQLVFRHRPGGRNVFMAAQNPTAALGRPPMQAPRYWKDSTKQGAVGHERIPVTQQEKDWIQQLLDGTFKKKATRDRDKGTPLPERYQVVSAVRSEHPELWEKFAKRRADVLGNVKKRGKEDFTVPKTKAASPGLCERCTHPTIGNPSNEQYLMHGSNPTSAMSILGTSFKIDFAGATAGTMFGPGIYLAEASSKADEYARDENTGGAYDGLFAVLICRAVVGRSFRTEKPGDYKDNVLKSNFDSVLGDREKAVGTYREFIFFHEGAVYPEYVAFYKRIYEDGYVPPPSAPASMAPTPMTMGAPTTQLQVQVPPGAVEGTLLQVQAPDGRTVQVTVPAGVAPGSVMTVQI